MPKTSKQLAFVLDSEAKAFIQLLLDAGHTRASIAEYIECHPSQVSLVASGDRTMSEKYFRRLVRLALKHNLF